MSGVVVWFLIPLVFLIILDFAFRFIWPMKTSVPKIIPDLFLLGSSCQTGWYFDKPIPFWYPTECQIPKSHHARQGEIRNILCDSMRIDHRWCCCFVWISSYDLGDRSYIINCLVVAPERCPNHSEQIYGLVFLYSNDRNNFVYLILSINPVG